jgi:hypothetical protein
VRRLLHPFAGGIAAVVPPDAAAHAGERGFVLLLPTGLYIAGGAAAVVLSFAVMACLPSRLFVSVAAYARPIARLPRREGIFASTLVLAVAILLVIAGFAGSRDPLDNPLPLAVWTLWWVGLTFAVALFGNLWVMLNPWRALYRLATLVVRVAPRPYPEALAYWPAVLLMLAFAWFELVYPAPLDPEDLAIAVLAYALITLAGMLAYGEERWLERGEAFSVFFRMVSWLSPLQPGPDRELRLGIPCRALIAAGRTPASGVAFVLVALAAVSFDGLSRTFWWIALAGGNPLEYPGRASFVAVNTLGLLATAIALGAAYMVAARLGSALASDGRGAAPVYGDYIVAIVPIAFGYHFAHYLPSFLVDVQYALRALADPFALGWNLLGARDLQVKSSFLSSHASVHLLWNIQVAGIVLAHVLAVFIAHLLALRRHSRPGAALASQAPLTALMVGYTVFGLWLLSTPVAT